MDLKNIDLSTLEALSPEEKSLVLSILQEYAEQGKSEKLDSLIMDDYEEAPVDFETFVDDNYYLGNAWHDAEGNSKLYPYWRKELKKIFPNNLDTSVNNAIFTGSRGRGKAQPLTSLVLTGSGFKQMGELTLDDKIYGDDGKLHTLMGIFPQGKKKVYRITFTDNTFTDCCEDHLWVIRPKNQVQYQKVFSTKELLNKKLWRLNSGKYKERLLYIPMTQPLQFEHKELFISPYIMGCLIGDGGLSNSSVTMTSADTESINRMRVELNSEYMLHKLKAKYSYRIIKKYKTAYRDEQGIVRAYPNLYAQEIAKYKLNTTSYYKYIPKDYLYNDIDSRIALLQGLMDTDGTVMKNGSIVQFNTVSPQLRDDIIWLVESLGGSAWYSQTQGAYYSKKENKKIICHISYTVNIKLPRYINPFYLSRKANRLKETRINPSRAIEKIEYIGEQECQCIYIDSDSHLYLTDHFIVTHNTEIEVLIGAYLLHRILCLKNPIEYFHLKSTEKLVFAFMNIKLDLAREIANTKFQNTIKSSPWFLAHGTLQGRTKKVWVPRTYKNENGEEQEAIDIKIGSQADDLIGLPIFFCAFDEVSFIRNKNVDVQKKIAYDMLDTAIGGAKTRFIYKGKNPTLICLASSKRSDKSFLEEHMKKKLISEKENVYISDGSVWEVKPPGTYSDIKFKVGLGNKFLQSLIIPEGDDEDTWRAKGYKIIEVPIDFKADFQDDIDRALCDFAGISSSSLSKYINGAAINDTLTDRIQNPFSSDILEIGNGPDDDREYYNFFDLNKVDPKLKSKPLFIHMDLSKSGDKTGIAGVFIKGKKPSSSELTQSNDLFFSLAFCVSIKAPKGRQISFAKNRNFIYWLKEKGFNIKCITTDTFQSVDTGQILEGKGFKYEVLSVDRVDTVSRVCKPYQYLKTTIYEKRIEMFNDRLLVSELSELERNMDTGKVDHPDGGSKDSADALCGSIFQASKFAEEFSYDYGEQAEEILRLNGDGYSDDVKQLTLDLEEELKHFGPVLKQIETLKDDPGTRDYYLKYSDVIIL